MSIYPERWLHLKIHTVVIHLISLVNLVCVRAYETGFMTSWSILVSNSKNYGESHKKQFEKRKCTTHCPFFLLNKLGAPICNDGIIFYCRLKAKSSTIQYKKITNILRNCDSHTNHLNRFFLHCLQ